MAGLKFRIYRVGNLSRAMRVIDRNQVGIGCRTGPQAYIKLGTQFKTRFLESIPGPVAGLKFLTQATQAG